MNLTGLVQNHIYKTDEYFAVGDFSEDGIFVFSDKPNGKLM